jgi:hypothetical protein
MTTPYEPRYVPNGCSMEEYTKTRGSRMTRRSKQSERCTSEAITSPACRRTTTGRVGAAT